MSVKCDVTLVTHGGLPDLAPDDRLLADALRDAGLRVRAAVWNDDTVGWADSHLTLVRSTWDYFHHVDDFRCWLDMVQRQSRLINGADLICWNIDKRYLAELEGRGVTIVPTHFVRRDARGDVEHALRAHDCEEIVIKPTVAGASFGARRFDLLLEADDARRHLTELLQRSDVMVQPYLHEVESFRERSLVFIGGVYSHAFRKAPFSNGSSGRTDMWRGYTACVGEISFAERVLAACPGTAHYARIDVVPTHDGLMLMEAELIEPGLLLASMPTSAARFAQHLLTLVGSEPDVPLRKPDKTDFRGAANART